MLVDEIAKNMQTEKQTDLILLDFSKNFDKVAQLEYASSSRQRCGPCIQQQILQNLKLYSAGQPAGLPMTTSTPLMWRKW